MKEILREIWILFSHYLLLTARNPVWIIVGLFQPVCYLLLYAPLLKDLPESAGFIPGGAMNTYTPGLLIMTAIFSTFFVGFGLMMERRMGVLERLRVTPVRRVSLLLGLVVRDVLMLLIQSVVLMGLSLLMGFRPNPLGLFLTLILMILIGTTMASTSYALALAIGNENAFASTMNFFAAPLVLLSGVMLPLVNAPTVIKAIVRFNPFAYAVDAARMIVNGDFAANVVWQTFLMFTLLSIAAVYLALWVLKRTNS